MPSQRFSNDATCLLMLSFKAPWTTPRVVFERSRLRAPASIVRFVRGDPLPELAEGLQQFHR